MTADTPAVLYVSIDRSGLSPVPVASFHKHPGAEEWVPKETLDALREALVDHNDLLRSAMQICERAIMHEEFRVLANWDAFHDRVSVTLKKHHQITNAARESGRKDDANG